MFELLFLLCFTLHNIEEAVWLPKWSRHAGKYHPAVSNNEFHFAVLVVTILGYLFTFLFLAWGGSHGIIKYLYLGFVIMMCFNALLPHLAATILLRRYAPGTLTGLFLNAPVGLYLVFARHGEGLSAYGLLAGFITISAVTLASLRPLFRLGGKLIDDY